MISRLTAPRFYFCAGRIEKAASLTSRPGGGLSCTLGLSHVEDVYIIFHRPSSSTCTRCHRVTSAAGVRLGGPPIVHAVRASRSTETERRRTERARRTEVRVRDDTRSSGNTHAHTKAHLLVSARLPLLAAALRAPGTTCPRALMSSAPSALSLMCARG